MVGQTWYRNHRSRGWRVAWFERCTVASGSCSGMRRNGPLDRGGLTFRSWFVSTLRKPERISCASDTRQADDTSLWKELSYGHHDLRFAP